MLTGILTFFTGIKSSKYVYFAIFVILVVGAFFIKQHYDEKDLVTTKVDAAVQKEEVKRMDQVVQSVVKSAEVTDKITAEAVQDIVKEQQQVVVVKQTTHKQVAAIEQKYAEQPKTPVVEKQRDDEISAARLDNTWQLWCQHASQPNSACPAN